MNAIDEAFEKWVGLSEPDQYTNRQIFSAGFLAALCLIHGPITLQGRSSTACDDQHAPEPTE